MWRYVLLSTPIVGLLLFFALTFEPALFLYLALVLLSFWLYYQLSERTQQYNNRSGVD
jgi:Kef-type K+ transport system membrane component KefB